MSLSGEGERIVDQGLFSPLSPPSMYEIWYCQSLALPNVSSRLGYTTLVSLARSSVKKAHHRAGALSPLLPLSYHMVTNSPRRLEPLRTIKPLCYQLVRTTFFGTCICESQESYTGFYLPCKSLVIMEQVQHIHSKGIYHGLPAFSDDAVGLTAIVVGANGMSGDHMVSFRGTVYAGCGSG